jgi:hypothetical protein
MAWTSTVSLPREHDPVFPPVCVVCGKQDPDGTLSLSDTIPGPFGCFLAIVGIFTPLAALWPRAREYRSAPACPQCARRLRLMRAQRHVLNVVALTVAAMAGLFVWVWVHPLAAAAEVIAVWIGLAVLGRWRPMPFNIYVWPKAIDYEFARSEYAAVFALLNGAAVNG